MVKEGMVIHTNSPKVRRHRRTNVELILSQHNCECVTLSLIHIYFDKLTLDVYTNGTLLPDEAVSLAAKVLSEHLRCV